MRPASLRSGKTFLFTIFPFWEMPYRLNLDLRHTSVSKHLATTQTDGNSSVETARAIVSTMESDLYRSGKRETYN